MLMSAHSYKDKITCPYCDYGFDASWEYFSEGFDSDGDEAIIQCEECGEDFEAILHVSYSYSLSFIGKKTPSNL